MPDEPKTARIRTFRARARDKAQEQDVLTAGFVLAGGRSSRMGRDKALLPFAGQPLIARALGTLREAGVSASISGARALLESLAPVVTDFARGLGPLSGICSALDSTAARWAVFVPVDLPLLPASLLAYLLQHAQTTRQAITLASVSGVAHTFPVVIDRAALPALEAELRAGRRKCFAAFEAAAAALGQPLVPVAVEWLVQSGHVSHPRGLPAVHWFLNVNSPEDLKRAETLA